MERRRGALLLYCFFGIERSKSNLSQAKKYFHTMLFYRPELAELKDRSPVKLSVAVITYNHESFIRQALESVLAQQVNFEYEIIVAEDHSTDNTRAIVMDFCQRYPDHIASVLQESNV